MQVAGKAVPVIRVVAFISSGDGDQFIASCLQYCSVRGYQVAELVRGDWPRALGMVAAGLVSAIVFPRRGDRPRNEGAGERTRKITRPMPSAAMMTRDDVLRLLDGEATIPCGLDPESIAAARRIARHFDQCRLN